MEITGQSLCKTLGTALDYSTAMTSFSPFYSDIGLGIDADGGIRCLFLHYNRRATRFLDPFLLLPKPTASPESTAMRVVQHFDGGTVSIAFCGHNTWVVECVGVEDVRFGVAHDPALEEARSTVSDGPMYLFEGHLPTLDKRDPDRLFPVILGLRVIAGDAGSEDGISAPVRIQTGQDKHIVLAFSVRMLDVDRDELLRRLEAASPDAADAARRTQAWIEDAMGSYRAVAEEERETSVLARCVHTLLSNSAEAPGYLAGRISAFPSRGRYPTHFLWDSCFQNLALELMHPRLAEDSLLQLTDNMRSDGKIPSFLCSTWLRPHDSQPPLIGWAGLRLVKDRNDPDLAARLLPALRRNTRWWLSQRMTRFGLVSAIGGIETGWDDSPRFDNGPTVACDMNSYLLMQMRACAEFCSLLGDAAGAGAHNVEADRFAERMVDVLFDPESGMFWDIHVESGESVRLKTPACFLPMLAGVPLPAEDMRSTIKRVLLDPATFFGRVPFPSVAYDEASYRPDAWWRGPTWLPVAYLMLLLLNEFGFDVEARAARETLYRMIIRDGNIRELFNSQTGEGLGAHEQGWTAAICLRLHRELRGQ